MLINMTKSLPRSWPLILVGILAGLAVLVGLISIGGQAFIPGSLNLKRCHAEADEVIVSPLSMDHLQWLIDQEKQIHPDSKKNCSMYLESAAYLRFICVSIRFEERSANAISNAVRLRMTPQLREVALFTDHDSSVTYYQEYLSACFVIDIKKMSLKELKSQIRASELLAYWAIGYRDLGTEMGFDIIPGEEYLTKHKISEKTVDLRKISIREIGLPERCQSGVRSLRGCR